MRGETTLIDGLILVTIGVIPEPPFAILTEVFRSEPHLGGAWGRKNSCFYRHLPKDLAKVLRSMAFQPGLLPFLGTNNRGVRELLTTPHSVHFFVHHEQDWAPFQPHD